MQRGIRLLEVFNSPYVIKNNEENLIMIDYQIYDHKELIN